MSSPPIWKIVQPFSFSLDPYFYDFTASFPLCIENRASHGFCHVLFSFLFLYFLFKPLHQACLYLPSETALFKIAVDHHVNFTWSPRLFQLSLSFETDHFSLHFLTSVLKLYYYPVDFLTDDFFSFPLFIFPHLPNLTFEHPQGLLLALLVFCVYSLLWYFYLVS